MQPTTITKLAHKFRFETENAINQAIADGVDPTREYLSVLRDLSTPAEFAGVVQDTPCATLLVEVDDAAVNMTIDGEDVIITGTGVKEIPLKPGQYKLRASKHGKPFRQELVTVTRNGRQVVLVTKE